MSPWFSHFGAAAMLAVVALYGLRIVVGIVRRTALSWDAEVIHLCMAVAMAGMLDRGLSVVPARVWLVLFGTAAAWFVGRSALAARRQLSGALVGSTLVHVGGCCAMVYMLVVVPPGGNMANMADLICGDRMAGMEGMSSGSLLTPWAGPAIALAVVLLAGAACVALPRFRGFGVGQPITIVASTTIAHLHPLRTARLVLGAQIAMCLVMTAALVAMYS
jgi:Domain of unknown function (DUF5134)